LNYRKNNINGDDLSILGLGCMRLPKDENEAEEMVLFAIEHGINYFDTAYIYGKSEETLGRILSKHNKRQEVKLATKLPPYFTKKRSDMDKIFNQQLERLQTDYIDYYLIHMLTDLGTWQRLLDLGVEKWIDDKKADGKIRNIGFSYHGGKEEFIKICDAYDWELCLIQYNYLDENNQAGKNGLLHASAKGIPVIIMEPLRGGMMANSIPKGAIRAFENAAVKKSPAEWSFRWLWNQPEVTCVLSGMNSIDIMKENLAAASTAMAGDFQDNDFEVIERVKQAFTDAIKVPCTGCSYCMPCPQGVDIPTCLSCYNIVALEGKLKALVKYTMQTSMKSKPQIASLCNKCGQCEKKCPQEIEIRTHLQNTKKTFEKFYFKPVMAIVRWFMRL